MDKSKLSDGEWVHSFGRLKKTPGIRVRRKAGCRRFVETVLWMLRSGAQWQLLPDRLGHLAQRVQAVYQLEPVWLVGADAGQYLGQG